MKKHGKIAFVPSELFEFGLEEKRLTPTDAIIWLFLIFRSNYKGKSWVSNVTIARSCGIARQTVISSISRLKAGGWLSVDGTIKTVNLRKLDELVAEEAFEKLALKVNDPVKKFTPPVQELDDQRKISDTDCPDSLPNKKQQEIYKKLIRTGPPEVGPAKNLFNSKEKIETRFSELKAAKDSLVAEFREMTKPTQQQCEDMDFRVAVISEELELLEADYAEIVKAGRL